MSSRVTRPSEPVPVTSPTSTPCSRARRRTRGETRRGRSPSTGAGSAPGGRGPGVPEAAGSEACAAGAGSGAGAAPGAGFEAGASGAAPPAAPAMTATTLSTGTVSPACTRMAVSTPDAGEGISASTLSVEISNRGSSRPTASPACFIQRTIVPSAIDSPSCGIRTLVTDRDTVAHSPPRQDPAAAPAAGRARNRAPLRGPGAGGASASTRSVRTRRQGSVTVRLARWKPGARVTSRRTPRTGRCSREAREPVPAEGSATSRGCGERGSWAARNP